MECASYIGPKVRETSTLPERGNKGSFFKATRRKFSDVLELIVVEEYFSGTVLHPAYRFSSVTGVYH